MCRRSVWWAVLCVLAVAGTAMGELVGHWRLDEGSGTILDSSGNGNDGTITGNPTPIPGVVGKALEFHGLGAPGGGGDYINCGSGASLDITGPISMALWIRPGADDPEGQGTETAPMAKAMSTASPSWSFQVRYGWGASEPYMAFTFNTSPRAWAFVGQNLEKDEWCHIACTYDGATLKCFLDGEETDSTPMGAITSSPAPVLIGSDGWGCDWIGGIDDVRMYNHSLTPKELIEVMLGGGPELAADPVPEKDANDVPREVVLGWTPGEYAATHDVYLGTVFEDVNDASRTDPRGVLISQDQADATCDPEGLLAFGQTYYWRVDEVNAAPDYTIFKGEVWSFTTEPLAYPVEGITVTCNATSEPDAGPENTINGSGLNADDQHSTKSSDMWLGSIEGDDPIWLEYDLGRICKLHEVLVWNYNVVFDAVLGFSVKDVTVEYSTDGTEWASLGDVELARSTGREDYTANSTVDMAGVAARYVRLTINDNWGALTQYGLSEVRFMHIPVQAREASPADGTTDVDPSVALGWRTGREAVSHDVYVGTDPEAMALAATVDDAPFAPDSLEFGTTYYWRVDEVNEAASYPVWTGEVWGFSTVEYALIDGFEGYTDDIEAGTTIFDTWIDGWVNETGSIVGYMDAPFAERTIVRSGKQSMPLLYDNSVAPFYSETNRELESPQDWTGYGADTLVLYVRGNPPAFLEQADGSILMGSTGGDIWGTADAFRFAYKRLSGNGSIQARVDSIVNTSAWAKGGVMIRETLDAGSKHAMTVVTPGNGVALQHRPTTNQASLNVNQAGPTAPYWVRITRTGNTLTAERSEDGTTWTSITADAAASSVTVSMADDVYIGLALVSNNAGASPTAAEFSNVSTTGSVSGQWQTADIGGGQLESNDPAPMYVRIEDASGTSATVTHPDDTVAVRPAWQEWTIPYSDLGGVNLSRVQTITIGVGSVTSPSAGGTGTVYIDDVGFGKPAAVAP